MGLDEVGVNRADELGSMSRQSLEFLGIIEALEGIHVLEIELGHAIAGKLLAGNTRPVYESVDHEVLIVARMAETSIFELLTSNALQCPSCHLRLNIDRMKSKAAFDALRKVQNAQENLERKSKFNG